MPQQRSSLGSKHPTPPQQTLSGGHDVWPQHVYVIGSQWLKLPVLQHCSKSGWQQVWLIPDLVLAD
jgi:hypothetical protein